MAPHREALRPDQRHPEVQPTAARAPEPRAVAATIEVQAREAINHTEVRHREVAATAATDPPEAVALALVVAIEVLEVVQEVLRAALEVVRLEAALAVHHVLHRADEEGIKFKIPSEGWVPNQHYVFTGNHEA